MSYVHKIWSLSSHILNGKMVFQSSHGRLIPSGGKLGFSTSFSLHSKNLQYPYWDYTASQSYTKSFIAKNIAKDKSVLT